MFTYYTREKMTMLVVLLNRLFKPAYIIDNWTKSLIKYNLRIKIKQQKYKNNRVNRGSMYYSKRQ